MSSRNPITLAIAEQDWQAVSRHHHTDLPRSACDTGIGLGWRCPFACFNHTAAMYLIQPAGFVRQAQGFFQTLTIASHSFGRIADMIAQIEAIERQLTHTARAQR